MMVVHLDTEKHYLLRKATNVFTTIWLCYSYKNSVLSENLHLKKKTPHPKNTCYHPSRMSQNSSNEQIFLKTEKAFYISKESSKESRGPREKKKKKKKKYPSPSTQKSFMKPETFWNDMGWLLSTYDSCVWMQVLCAFFSSLQLSGVAERWAAVAKKVSPHVISDL